MSLVHSGGINFIVHECNACFYVKLLVISCQVTRNWFAVKVAQVENLRVKFVFHTQIFPLFLFYHTPTFAPNTLKTDKKKRDSQGKLFLFDN